MLHLVFLLLIGSIQLSQQAGIKRTEDASFWRSVGENHLKKVLASLDHTEGMTAKNIVVFLGDGMGMTTITAGRIFKGQQNGQSGEEASLSFDEFPNIGLAKTYNVDKQVPDSAGTATALFSGVKTTYGTIGMDSTAIPTNSEQGKLTSIMDWAISMGKRTGIVTTTRISHATPAALYSKVHSRKFECDSEITEESAGIYKDISRQLIEDLPGKRLNVILGGGKLTMGAADSQPDDTILFSGSMEKTCSRTDGRNLTEEWLDIGPDRSLALSRDDLFAIDTKKANHLLGVFNNNHISYAATRPNGREPSLPEMTEKALEVLIRDDSKGFVLLVEGGRIDHGHHQNLAKLALEEILEMDQAIELVLQKTSAKDTLIIVTADHSHAMTMNGYPKRGNDILGFANKEKMAPYETLTYANGPGYFYHHLNATAKIRDEINRTGSTVEESSSPIIRDPQIYPHLAGFPLEDETHGGEDVPVYAYGPGANLIRGVFEQNYVAYVISYAGCFGPVLHLNKMCIRGGDGDDNPYLTGNSSGIASTPSLVPVILVYLVSFYCFLTL